MEKWRNGKPLPAGMGYVIAGASTLSWGWHLELPPHALQKQGHPFLG